MSQNMIIQNSTLVQVIPCCRQATRKYLVQYQCHMASLGDNELSNHGCDVLVPWFCDSSHFTHLVDISKDITCISSESVRITGIYHNPSIETIYPLCYLITIPVFFVEYLLRYLCIFCLALLILNFVTDTSPIIVDWLIDWLNSFIMSLSDTVR